MDKQNTTITAHRIPGLFIAKTNDRDHVVTRNLVPGESVYGEELFASDALRTEYRVWNPFGSNLAAAVLGGIGDIAIGPGKSVLLLGAASLATLSHVSDIVGPEGVVYAVEFAEEPSRQLTDIAKKRTNVIPVIEDPRNPTKYQPHIPSSVDVIFAELAQPDQTQTVITNATAFLKNDGHVVMSMTSDDIDSTQSSSTVYTNEVQKLKDEHFTPLEMITLEPYCFNRAVLVARYNHSATERGVTEAPEQLTLQSSEHNAPVGQASLDTSVPTTTSSSSSQPIHGACFCKRTTYIIPNPHESLAFSAYCHCSRCARLAGAPFIWTTHWRGKDGVQWSVSARGAEPSDEEPTRFPVVEGVKFRLRCPECGAQVGTWNERSQQWSVWPIHFTRNQDTNRLLVQEDPEQWAWIKPTAHIFYGTRVLDINDDLGKWEGYEGKSKRIG